jgi:hypothetical protein
MKDSLMVAPESFKLCLLPFQFVKNITLGNNCVSLFGSQTHQGVCKIWAKNSLWIEKLGTLHFFDEGIEICANHRSLLHHLKEVNLLF